MRGGMGGLDEIVIGYEGASPGARLGCMVVEGKKELDVAVDFDEGWVTPRIQDSRLFGPQILR